MFFRLIWSKQQSFWQWQNIDVPSWRSWSTCATSAGCRCRLMLPVTPLTKCKTSEKKHTRREKHQLLNQCECEYLHTSLKQIRKYFVIRKRKTSDCYNYDACAQSTGLCMSQAPGGRNMKVQCCVHPWSLCRVVCVRVTVWVYLQEVRLSDCPSTPPARPPPSHEAHLETEPHHGPHQTL